MTRYSYFDMFRLVEKVGFKGSVFPNAGEIFLREYLCFWVESEVKTRERIQSRVYFSLNTSQALVYMAVPYWFRKSVWFFRPSDL